MTKNDALNAVVPILLALSFASAEAKVPDAEATRVCNIARDGMLEVSLAKIALQNAKSQKVKDFAEQMKSDHSAANEALKEAAKKDDLELPTDLTASQKQKENSLKALSGAAFDDKYMAEMVTAHKKAVEAIGAEVSTGTGNLKAWAEKTLPIIKEHKIEAKSLDSNLAK